MAENNGAQNNVSFSRTSIRTLLGLSSEDQTRVHTWVKQLATALQKGEMPGSNPEDASGEMSGNTHMKLTPYGGPFFGVDLDERVHLVCAFTEKSCAVFALNKDGKFDY